MLEKDILHSALEAIEAAKKLVEDDAVSFIDQVSSAIVSAYEKKGKVLVAGNGGSLCDAMHFAEELTGFYRKKRKALAAIALADPGHMTCVGNDLGFNHIFSRHIEAIGQPHDVFICLTTSGNSANLVQAVHTAKKMGLTTVAFLGKTGGKLLNTCDYQWIVDGFSTSDRIQEAHMAAIHIVIEMVEKKIFSTSTSSTLTKSYATSI